MNYSFPLTTEQLNQLIDALPSLGLEPVIPKQLEKWQPGEPRNYAYDFTLLDTRSNRIFNCEFLGETLEVFVIGELGNGGTAHYYSAKEMGNTEKLNHDFALKIRGALGITDSL